MSYTIDGMILSDIYVRRNDMKKRVIGGFLFGLLVGCSGGITYCLKRKQRIKSGNDCNRLNGYYETLAQWLTNIQNGLHVEDYLKEKGVQTVAIYGMGELGILLYNELKDSTDIQVLYGIDQSGVSAIDDFDVYYPEDDLPDADLVIVTPISYMDEIVSKLKGTLDCKFASIRDVMYWK